LISYHLKQLLTHKLVSERRSAADGRDIYFSLRLDQLRQVYLASGLALHPGMGDTGPEAQVLQPIANQPQARVLFLCTHNSARSQMAEALLRHHSQGQIDVHSAGNEPSEIHPLAIRAMAERGISLDGQRSKHLSEFLGQHFDYIVTVCDIAREACPVFPDDPEQIHWSFADPSAITDREARVRAFERTATELTTRINYLLLLIRRQQRDDLRRPGG
jgi:ArsR family transcriptional regulator, arsenate/arsenite/antimonite-responsive transcriptional repressor / arsenate reductase (thioredoxin)